MRPGSAVKVMSMFQAPLPALARLMFKNHHELASLLGSASAMLRTLDAAPLLDLNLAGTRCSLGVGRNGQSLTLHLSQERLAYDIDVRMSGEGAPSLKAVLTNRASGERHELSGAEFFDSKVPAAFEKLHAEVLAQLQALVPAAVWAKLREAGVPAPSAAVKQSDAGPTQAASSAETPAQETGAASAVEQAPVASTPALSQFVISRKDAPDLRFTGELLARAATRAVNGRWAEMHVFKTRAGRFVALKVGRTLWLGESDRVEVQVFDTLEQVGEFLGHSGLAKFVKDELGIREFEDIA